MGSRSRASGQQALCVYAGCEPGKTIAVIAEWWAAPLPMYPYCSNLCRKWAPADADALLNPANLSGLIVGGAPSRCEERWQSHFGNLILSAAEGRSDKAGGILRPLIPDDKVGSWHRDDDLVL